MAIATQSVSPAYVGRGVTVASTSFTIKSALTILAGSGLRLRVMACISRSEISKYDGGGITWNGVALTKIGTPTTGGSGEYCVHWELIAPTPGTGDIIITNTGTTNDGTFWWIVETGTNGSPATGYALENNSATSATPAATVPAGASAIVCGASFAYATATPGVLSGTTQIGTNESHRYCGQRTDAAAPGVGTWASANQVAAFTSVVGAAAVAPVLTGGITADEAVASGNAGTVVSSVATLPFRRNPGSGAAVVSVPGVGMRVLADDVGLGSLSGAVLNLGGDGRLVYGNGVPVPAGTSVIVVTREPGANGALGVERYITY